MSYMMNINILEFRINLIEQLLKSADSELGYLISHRLLMRIKLKTYL